jgi:hypothetical protein
VAEEDTPFGTRYIAEGQFSARDGRRPNLRAIWFLELEVFTLDGKTLAVVSAYAHQVRPLGKREVAQARALELA